ncbi:MAG: RagB/SusD family nutrient uptake outer membrane protein, partial [Ferruginibacter sp.]
MKRNKIILMAFAGMVTFSSCKKLIEIPDTDLLAGANALSQVTYVEQAILGGYAAATPDMDILLNATFADEVAKAEFYNAVTTHEWQYSPADVGLRDNFTAIGINYTIINRVNLALEALPNADSTKVGDEVKRRRLRGEGLFLRAFAHFELFRFYCKNYDPAGLGMPYMETSSILPIPRIAMGPYFVKIKADLAEAKTLVVNSLADVNRANVAAVAGMQARVALYMRDWAAAETFASEFITAVPLATIAQFPGIWTDVNTSEQAYR